MEASETDQDPLRPVVDLTPAACREVHSALQRGLEAFRRWDIEPPPGSWIQEAASWLEHVVDRNSLGDTDDDLRRTSAAVALAVDLYQIGTCLGDDANRLVAVELSAIGRGRMLGRGDESAGRDYLSQFWVGALLAQSKLRPHVLGYDAKGRAKPDFIIQRGSTRFAVEAKRPRTAHSAKRAVLQAGSQLRTFDGPGIIVIDATECMSVDLWGVVRSGPTIRQEVRSEVKALHGDLEHVITSYTRSGKFSQISMIMTFARYWSWILTDEPRRDAGIHFHCTGFPYLWSNQITQLTKEIQDALLIGVEQLTGNPPSYEYT